LVRKTSQREDPSLGRRTIPVKDRLLYGLKEDLFVENKQLWALRWHPQGFSNVFNAFIIAEDTFEANYFWNKFRKENKGVAHTWDRAFGSPLGRTTFHTADAFEKDAFRKLFPRRRKAGVYLCKETRYNDETDHVRD
jgi:hypothetical protein